MVSIFKCRFSIFSPSFPKSHLLLIFYDFIGAYVGSGSSSNGLVFVWDAASGDMKKKLEGHEAGVCGFAWGRGGSSGQQVASVDKKGKLILWA
jgi:WD40 repeat protein